LHVSFVHAFVVVQQESTLDIALRLPYNGPTSEDGNQYPARYAQRELSDGARKRRQVGEYIPELGRELGGIDTSASSGLTERRLQRRQVFCHEGADLSFAPNGSGTAILHRLPYSWGRWFL